MKSLRWEGTVFEPPVGSWLVGPSSSATSTGQAAPCAGCSELHPALKCGLLQCVCVGSGWGGVHVVCVGVDGLLLPYFRTSFI